MIIDFNRFSILSVWGKKANILSYQEYAGAVLANCDNYSKKIKEARAAIKQNKNKGTEMYL